MAKIVEPTTQFLVPTPNSHVNYVFDTSSTLEEYRTARYLNHITNIFGVDKVLRGLDVQTYSLTSNDFSITLNSGVLIQDSTLVEILYPFEKELTSLSSTLQSSTDHYIIIYTDFQFLSVTTIPTTNPNPFNIYIGILDNTTGIVYNQDPNTTGTAITWNTNTNRIVLYAAPITDLENTSVEININGYIYDIRGKRQGSTVFNYNVIDCFDTDGGEISLIGDN